MVVGFCGVLLFFFVPESFWDRSPVPKSRKTSKNASKLSIFSGFRSSKPVSHAGLDNQADGVLDNTNQEKGQSPAPISTSPKRPAIIHRPSTTRNLHVGFAPDEHEHNEGNKSHEDSTTPAEGMTPLQHAHSGRQCSFAWAVQPDLLTTEKSPKDNHSITTMVQSMNGSIWSSQQAGLLLLHSYMVSNRLGIMMWKDLARITWEPSIFPGPR